MKACVTVRRDGESFGSATLAGNVHVRLIGGNSAIFFGSFVKFLLGDGKNRKNTFGVTTAKVARYVHEREISTKLRIIIHDCINYNFKTPSLVTYREIALNLRMISVNFSHLF